MKVAAVMLMLMAGIAIADDSPEPPRAIDATIDAPNGNLSSAGHPAEAEKSLREAHSRRVMSNCLISRGLSAQSCRRRLPSQDVSISRAQARNLAHRYRGPSGLRGRSSRYPGGYPSRW